MPDGPMKPLGAGFYWAGRWFNMHGLHFHRWGLRLWLLPLSPLRWWKERTNA